MKASQLIAILAKHLNEHGDHEVFVDPQDLKRDYMKVTRCWFNFGKDWGKDNRFIIGSKELGE